MFFFIYFAHFFINSGAKVIFFLLNQVKKEKKYILFAIAALSFPTKPVEIIIAPGRILQGGS